jgi:hypothetical protein
MDDPELTRTVPPPVVSGLMVTAVLALMMFAFPRPPGTTRTTCMIAAFFGFSLSTIFTAAWFYRTVDNAKVVLTIWLIVYCLLPMGVDFCRDRIVDRDEPGMTMLSSFSPLGLIIEASTDSKVNLRPASIFHVLIPLLPLGLYLRRRQP